MGKLMGYISQWLDQPESSDDTWVTNSELMYFLEETHPEVSAMTIQSISFDERKKSYLVALRHKSDTISGMVKCIWLPRIIVDSATPSEDWGILCNTAAILSNEAKRGLLQEQIDEINEIISDYKNHNDQLFKEKKEKILSWSNY